MTRSAELVRHRDLTIGVASVLEDDLHDADEEEDGRPPGARCRTNARLR